MDVGSVRHWPRVPEAQLARIMSTKGRLTRLASNNSPSAQKQKAKAAVVASRNVRDEDEDAEVVARPASRARVTASVAPAPQPETAAQVVGSRPDAEVAARGDARAGAVRFRSRLRLLPPGARRSRTSRVASGAGA